jgi:Protein of unknown function (DUF3604)
MSRSGWFVSSVFAGLLCSAGCNDPDSHSTPSPAPTTPPSAPTATTGAASPTPVLSASPTAPQPASSPTPPVATRTAPTATSTARTPCAITPGPLPFERTECRPRCDHYDPLKQPFFGETHLHTGYSFDAAVLDTRNLPPDAYRYAKGGVVGLPPWADTRSGTPTPGSTNPTQVTEFPYCLPGEICQYSATRSAQLPPGRALDFAAVTDHSEQFGENNICLFEGTAPCTSDAECTLPGQVCSGIEVLGTSGVCVPDGYDSQLCKDARLGASRLRSSPIAGIIAGFENLAENPTRPPGICGNDGSRCTQQAQLVWGKIIEAAEEAYDRTSSCTFTSFIAYEYTAMAANGRCSADLLPCWDEQGTGQASRDCAGFADPAMTQKQTCESDFVGSAGGDNLHRNIIFRNDDVIDAPLSNVEAPLACGVGSACNTPGQVASPAQMLLTLRQQCMENPRHPRCDVISIPHNPNMSRGSMFLIPESLDEAQIRHDLEPLVELMQVKGQSECRYSPATGTYWSQDPNAPDELCDFENMSYSRLNGAYVPPDQQDKTWLPPAAYVRETLKNGIRYEAENGINPFRLGFVGGLDNHNGTPGQSEETDYAKNGAHGIQSFAVSGEILNEKFFLGYETNGGALTVAWAEENSRDSIFTALKNRETYATSGTRPIVRFFGGFDLPADLCDSGSFVERGYADGVPMGGCLSGAPDPSGQCVSGDADQQPRFAVSAMMDPGWPGHSGTPLQRIQIVKGWVDSAGATHDQVYDVAGDADNGAGVDLKTCNPTGDGAPMLCAVWSDAEFDPSQYAFYYARVLENPSCRWNQSYCNARGVDCSLPLGTCSSLDHSVDGRGCNGNDDCDGGVCTPPTSYTELEYRQCCGDVVPKTVQQRAWTSPIWYSPSAGDR